MAATKVQRTTEYGKFKYLPFNREINKSSVDRLAKEINFQNYLHLNPIVVTPEMQVIDGQHRLEAAKRLGVPVYYVVADYIPSAEAGRAIQVYNSNRRDWTVLDFVHIYKNTGKGGYEIIAEISRKFSIKEKFVYTVIHAMMTEEERREFRKGIFDMSDFKEEIFSLFLILKNILNEVVDKAPSVPLSCSLYRGLYWIISHPKFNHERFMHRLSLSWSLVHRCSSPQQYFDMFKAIYNHKHRDGRIDSRP